MKLKKEIYPFFKTIIFIYEDVVIGLVERMSLLASDFLHSIPGHGPTFRAA